jgi:hypothetical protein
MIPGRLPESATGERPHALVVGGTGMLAGVSSWLASQGYATSVVARRQAGLDSLVRAARARGEIVNPLPVDYTDDARFRHGLKAAVEAHGPIVLAVCWIHSTAPRAMWTVAEVVSSGDDAARLILVRGSAFADPSRPDEAVETRMAHYPGLSYEVVVLGFVLEAGGSRWLTNQEITAGVIDAIQKPAARTIVGVVEPWSLRP